MRSLFTVLAAAFSALALPTFALAQDALLQGWYWDYPKGDGADAWAERIRGEAADLGRAGFTHVWLPPLSRAASGPNSNGYDPQDLYDLGEFGLGRTGFGTRAQTDAAIGALRAAGVSAVADVVYNHRDGGAEEVNPALEAYVTNHYDARKQPFPSDRFSVRLPLGGASGNGAGTYYFKLSSKSADARFHGVEYRLTMTTSRRVGFGGFAREAEPNGGGDCGQAPQALRLRQTLIANIDDPDSGCGTDEIEVTIAADDFDPAGDFIYVSISNPNGNYADQRFYGIWNASAQRDVVDDLEYVTRTDYTRLPSGRGGMTFENFKPNSANAATTFLAGDYDYPFFFSDYDQDNLNTRSVLTTWTDWLFDDAGIGGLRMDAVKHFDPAYLGELLLHLEGTGRAPSLYVGEFFDGNPAALAAWVRGVTASAPGARTPVRVFDFALRNALKEACDNPFADVRAVFESGVVDAGTGLGGFNVVTFVNNHDFRSAGEPVQRGANLAYAYLLTNNQVGLPTVYYPDYAGASIPNAPLQRLKPEIDALLEVQREAIAGASARTYLSQANSGFGGTYLEGRADELLLYQLRDTPSGRDVIVAINFGDTPLRVDHAIQTGGDVQPGTRFTDQLGRSAFPTATVDGDGRIYIDLPARSYSVWREGDTALPATLTALDARPVGRVNEVRWSATGERGLDRYDIERASGDAPDAFTVVGALEARGSDAAGYAEYAWRDGSPATESYYRLRVVDEDGTEALSEVVAVARARSAPTLRLSPNPAARGGGLAHVELADAAGGTLRLVDPTGRLLVERAVSGGERVALPTTHLPAGVYTVSLVGASDGESVRLVVQ